jgi:hypothetical protein
MQNHHRSQKRNALRSFFTEIGMKSRRTTSSLSLGTRPLRTESTRCVALKLQEGLLLGTLARRLMIRWCQKGGASPRSRPSAIWIGGIAAPRTTMCRQWCAPGHNVDLLSTHSTFSTKKVYKGLKRRGQIKKKSTQNEHLLESRSHGTSGRSDLQPLENLKREEDEGPGAAQVDLKLVMTPNPSRKT